MLTEEAPATIHTLRVSRDILISAPIEIVFETLFQPVGLFHEMTLKLEAWPGGRWFRDLGNNAGHLWGHVQVIKPPKLLEITGPMMMSYPAVSHLQYRLTDEAGGTRLALLHQAIGLLTADHRQGLQKGWEMVLNSVRDHAEKKKAH